jgi:hypothetical protein
VPDEYTWQAEPGDVLVLACDGLWDVMTSKQVARKVHDDFVPAADLAVLAKDLIEKAYAMESTDNISCVVAAFGPFVGPEKPAKELTLGKYMRARPEEKLRYQAFWAYNGFEQPTEPMPQIPQRAPKEAKGKKGKKDVDLKPLERGGKPPEEDNGLSVESVLTAALAVNKPEDRMSSSHRPEPLNRPEPLPVVLGQPKVDLSPVSPSPQLQNFDMEGTDLNATLRSQRDPLNVTLRTSSFHPPSREPDAVDENALFDALAGDENGSAIWHYITRAQ